jgi:hypothetical protein
MRLYARIPVSLVVIGVFSARLLVGCGGKSASNGASNTGGATGGSAFVTFAGKGGASTNDAGRGGTPSGFGGDSGGTSTTVTLSSVNTAGIGNIGGASTLSASGAGGGGAMSSSMSGAGRAASGGTTSGAGRASDGGVMSAAGRAADGGASGGWSGIAGTRASYGGTSGSGGSSSQPAVPIGGNTWYAEHCNSVAYAGNAGHAGTTHNAGVSGGPSCCAACANEAATAYYNIPGESSIALSCYAGTECNNPCSYRISRAWMTTMCVNAWQNWQQKYLDCLATEPWSCVSTSTGYVSEIPSACASLAATPGGVCGYVGR